MAEINTQVNPGGGNVPIDQNQQVIIPANLAKLLFTAETIESLHGIGPTHNENAAADSPVLVPPELLLWLNMLSLSPTMPEDKNSVENVLAAAELKQQEIVINMLTAWNKSVQEDAKRAKENMKEYAKKMEEIQSARHDKEIKAERGSGAQSTAVEHERWLKALTPEERTQFEALSSTYNGLQNRYNFDNAVSSQVNATVSSVSSSSGGGVVSGAAYQTAMVGFIAMQLGSSSPLEGVTGASDSIMQTFQKAVPTYSVDLGTIVSANNLITINLAVTQTLKAAAQEGGADEKKLESKFASQYAQEVIQSINGDEFPNFVLSIMAHSMDRGEPLNAKQRDDLISQAKVVWLSAAMALLYKLSTSYKGEGGGITGEEFMAMLENKDLPTGMKMLREALLGVLDTMPPEDGKLLLSTFADSLHSNMPVSSLTDPGKLFASFYSEQVSSYPIV
jgi:hypothetical protein